MKNSMRATKSTRTISRTTVHDVVTPILGQCYTAQAELKRHGELNTEAYRSVGRLISFCLGQLAAEPEHAEPGAPQLRAVR